MLSVRDLTVYHEKDLRVLMRGVTFTLSGQDRLAVIGEEGDGKSTLLKLICAPESAAYCTFSGVIAHPGEVLGYLPQEMPPAWRDQPVYACCGEHKGFTALSPKELNALCARLQLSSELCYSDQPFGRLSGGEKVKLQLLLALACHPTMLVLDEPSNDLDLPALRFLEKFICACGLPVLYISHDETLLSRTATRILHFEMAHHKREPRWTLANVPYERYMEERGRALEKQEQLAQMERRKERAQQQRFQRIQQAVEHAQATVSRQDPSTGRLLKKKMKAVKSLEHRFEREKREQTERPNIEMAMDASFTGDHSLPAGKRIIDVSLPVLSVQGRVLARGIELTLIGSEKVLLIGENGCGKTTLMRLIAEQAARQTALCPLYIPQRYEEELPEAITPIEYLHTAGDKEQLTRLRTCLGAFHFTREEMARPIGRLSGGQKSKLLWAKAVLSDTRLLLLDEPTRNLSPLSAPVVRRMMCDFQGAVLTVTHDRTLMRMWPGRILRLTGEGLITLKPEEIAAL